MPKLTLKTPTDQIFMIGPAYASRLKKLNIFTAENLLHHYPVRYLDRSLVTKISKVQEGASVTVRGQVVSAANLVTPRGKKIQKVKLEDDSGTIEATWFNQPFIPQSLKPGMAVALSGPVDRFGAKLTLKSPEYELIKPPPRSPLIHTGRLVPVYPETTGVSSKWLRSRIKFLLDNLLPTPDFLPEKITVKNRLTGLTTALKNIHFPKSSQELESAQNRLKFDELFLLQLEALITKKRWQEKKLAHSLSIDQEKVLSLIARLPFKLTLAQNRTLKEILSDLEKDKPANRLLAGDVGSGKTVVAAAAIYVSFLNGFKSVLLAPTEILANQHFDTLKTVFAHTPVKLVLVTSASKTSPQALRDSDLLIGTHALLFKKLNFVKLGLVVIDEQHRFGVKQRSQLLLNSKVTPHLLTMTATPIPRIVALTFYSDLDLSLLDEMPPGRMPVKTWVVPPQKRPAAYRWIDGQITAGKAQAFVVCPLIEESSKEKLSDIKNVTAEYNQLSQVFSRLRLGLLHGRLKSLEKKRVIADFSQGKTDILVTTPVIEVGLDIPGATIMLVEDADRFGLAQLHQLRGRVGRGQKPSYCLLFTSAKNPTTIKRLKYLESVDSGLKLAEIDLKLRGPGQLYGVKQHGHLELKLASLSDTKLILKTLRAAETVAKKLPSALRTKLKSRKITTVAPN